MYNIYIYIKSYFRSEHCESHQTKNKWRNKTVLNISYSGALLKNCKTLQLHLLKIFEIILLYIPLDKNQLM